LEHLRLYASALAGSAVDVVGAEPGALAWTDGTTVFVDPSIDASEQVRMVSVQAALLGAGSLSAPILRQLVRRRTLARQYLRVEAHRALATIEDLLPAVARSILDPAVASSVTTADESLAIARSEPALSVSPTLGTIHARRVLVPKGAAEPTAHHAQGLHHVSRGDLAELADDTDLQSGGDFPSSPVGGGGAVGRLLRRLLRPARMQGGGPPGADAATHITRSGGGARRRAAMSANPDQAFDTAADLLRRDTTYPEWDVHHGRYRSDWCTVLECDAPMGSAAATLDDGLDLRRSLSRLGLELTPCRRQPQGSDIDIDAAVEAHVDHIAGSPHDDDFYIESLRRRRDLSVVVLLDVSGSAAEPGPGGTAVHALQRQTATALTVALHQLGDRVALYAFNSRGRTAVHFLRVKRFEDGLDTDVARRLDGLVPAAYTRLGAAIRHGSHVVEVNGGTARRLLIVVSDGFAYDHGYEGQYGQSDARRALVEARRNGVGCLCISVGASTELTALRRVFGAAAHVAVPRPEQLASVIGPLFRAALGSAEVQRRAHRRRERTRERLDIERRTDGDSAVLRAGR
jgi:Mg-chelatase subunit ChlD